MTNSTLRKCAFLLASTALATPALAQTGAIDPPAPPKAQVATGDTAPESNEIIVTAQKREENLSKVPLSIQAIGTKRLDQLNISNFEQYTKQLPSVSFQTTQPGVTVVYMRGVATGGDGNHSGSLPSVGTYLDEQPVTTVGGTLDIHIYDIARIESLAGPQGTLYGASSQAGTIRIITNKPELGVTSGRIDVEGNTVSHGGQGGKLEGMINLPIADRIAFRGVAYYQRDAGYIDNVLGSRSYALPEGSTPASFQFTNANLVKKNFNPSTYYGGRAALKIDLDDSWTVTPTVLHQELKTGGNFSYDPAIGDLKIDRFFPEPRKDKFTQAALTVAGKIGSFDLTYAGAYLDRRTFSSSDYTDYTDAYDVYYSSVGGLLSYQNYTDNNGQIIDPRQHIDGSDHFKKMSHELRLATPSDKPFRVIAGAFYQRQSNDIYQNYKVDNLATSLSVPGYSGTVWLTKQKRIDRDYALFGEATYDISPKFSMTAGGRVFRYDNTLFGFAGLGPNNPGGFSSGYNRCLTTDGSQLRDQTGAPLAPGSIAGIPCSNVANVVNGVVVPRQSKGHGFTHRLNAQFKPTNNLMFYATWSRGFRPGGINRQPNAPAYLPDYLTNYEAGVKVTMMGGAVHWNTAVYHQIWKKFQFSYLGENSLTVILNGRDATINGVESDISYVGGGFTLNAAGAYTDAKTKQNICDSIFADANCTGDTIIAAKGTRLPITPQFKGTATARYSWPIMNNAKAHVQSGVSYQSSANAGLRSSDVALLGKLPAYALVDAAAGIDWRSFNIELFVSNLLDKRNQLTRFVACSICERVLVVPGTPRTIGLRAGYKF
jgi:iron complex outermembrane receptor protein